LGGGIHAVQRGWRRPFGAGEDRNAGGLATSDDEFVPWRRPFGAGEDRNSTVADGASVAASGGAGPSGLARIATLVAPRSRVSHSAVAPALRGWRGSQRCQPRYPPRRCG